jgi:hypothetical protein
VSDDDTAYQYALAQLLTGRASKEELAQQASLNPAELRDIANLRDREVEVARESTLGKRAVMLRQLFPNSLRVLALLAREASVLNAYNAEVSIPPFNDGEVFLRFNDELNAFAAWCVDAGHISDPRWLDLIELERVAGELCYGRSAARQVDRHCALAPAAAICAFDSDVLSMVRARSIPEIAEVSGIAPTFLLVLRDPILAPPRLVRLGRRAHDVVARYASIGDIDETLRDLEKCGWSADAIAASRAALKFAQELGALAE